VIAIDPPRIEDLVFHLVGTEPLVLQRFSQKQLDIVAEGQKAGSTKRGKKVREPKDFDALYEAAKYISEEGWLGMSASAFRSAMISACRTVDFPMVRAKLAIFIKADGYDKFDHTPLVRIHGEPRKWLSQARNATGVIDVRSRPMFRDWRVNLHVQYDSQMFTASDIANLCARAGRQVGIGEGRPDSRQSNGMGFGLYRLVND